MVYQTCRASGCHSTLCRALYTMVLNPGYILGSSGSLFLKKKRSSGPTLTPTRSSESLESRSRHHLFLKLSRWFSGTAGVEEHRHIDVCGPIIGAGSSFTSRNDGHRRGTSRSPGVWNIKKKNKMHGLNRVSCFQAFPWILCMNILCLFFFPYSKKGENGTH